MTKIKAIVFDFGGVLFQNGSVVAAENLCREKRYDKATILDAFESPKSRELRAGLITDDEFWEWAKCRFPAGYDTYGIRTAWHEGYILDNDIFELVKKLRGRYKVFAFSGNEKSRVEYLDNKYDFRKYFDLEVYSFNFGLNKGDRKFVEALIGEARMKPAEMIYIDDEEKNLSIARAFGINTILYRTGKITETEKHLKAFGIEF